MTNGWIKLHRNLLDKAIFMNPHALQVFLYCLMKATYKDLKLAVGNQVIYLKPGQLLYGRKSVSQRLQMGEGRLRGVMEYLESNGTITMERHSRYSIVTIVNWEAYQNGEGVPNIPFDCDFFEEDGEFEPPYNHCESRAVTGLAEAACETSATCEPQYNNINNTRKENKTREHKLTENQKPSENRTDIQNIADTEHIENIQNICQYRQCMNTSNDFTSQKGLRGCSSQDVCPSAGEPFTKGEGASVVLAGAAFYTEPCFADDTAEAFAALSTLDEAALDTYFASCDYAQFDSVIPTENLHDISTEMVYDLTDEEAERVEVLFAQQNMAAAADMVGVLDDPAASVDEIDPYEQTYIAAHQMFEHLWKLYPVKAGKEKVSEAQILYLYEEVGEKRMKQAIWRYVDKKHRVPKKYWQNGSTFFNGGYEDYLVKPVKETADFLDEEVV